MNIDTNLQNPTIRRTLLLQLSITIVFAGFAGLISGEQGVISAILGGLISIFASLMFVVVADYGLRYAKGTGLWPLLRAELVKLVFIAVQLGVIFKFYDALVVPAMFITFLVTLLAWRMTLFASGAKTDNKNDKQNN